MHFFLNRKKLSCFLLGSGEYIYIYLQMWSRCILQPQLTGQTFNWEKKGLLIELVILVIKNIWYFGACVKCYFIYIWFFILCILLLGFVIFLILFLYIIIVLSVRIFLTSEDVNRLVLLFCFIIKCWFMVLFSERW